MKANNKKKAAKTNVPFLNSMRQFLYKYLPKWNWLQWLVSLLSGVNHRYQRQNPKQVWLCWGISMGLVIWGAVLMIKGHGFSIFVNGCRGIALLHKYLPKHFWPIFLLAMLR